MEPLHVTIDDPAVRNLIDGYLARRRDEVERISQAIENDDFATLRVIGHNLHGSGGAYGLEGLSVLGAALETHAARRDVDGVTAVRDSIVAFLDRLVIR